MGWTNENIPFYEWLIKVISDGNHIQILLKYIYRVRKNSTVTTRRILSLCPTKHLSLCLANHCSSLKQARVWPYLELLNHLWDLLYQTYVPFTFRSILPDLRWSVGIISCSNRVHTIISSTSWPKRDICYCLSH